MVMSDVLGRAHLFHGVTVSGMMFSSRCSFDPDALQAEAAIWFRRWFRIAVSRGNRARRHGKTIEEVVREESARREALISKYGQHLTV